MRFLKVRLEGYAGIYNGLGLYVLDLDLTKARNKIVVISGPNGVGKSTLLNALSILPDGNDNFLPSVQASKYLQIFDNGNIYDITILHPLDKHNNRAVSKASIRKNGEELNPNGNIGSYKEIVFSEFDLDSNYLALSKLSSDDRGLADKKPAERKKFVSSILASLNVYNEINKTLNKKFNIFKSYINNLSTKIQQIGDETNLRTTLVSIDGRIQNLTNTIEINKAEIVRLETILQMNQVNGSMQEEYEKLSREKNSSSIQVAQKQNAMNKFLSIVQKDYENESFNLSMMDHKRQEIESFIREHEDKQKENQIISSTLLSRVSNLSNEIEAIKIKLEKIQTTIDTSLVDQIQSYQDKIAFIKQEFEALQIRDFDNISVEEIQYLLQIIDQIVNLIDSFYESISDDMMSYIFKDNIYQRENIRRTITNYSKQFDLLEEAIHEGEQLSLEYSMDDKLFNSLQLRPKSCKDNSCYFVKDAMNTLNQKYHGSLEEFVSQYDQCKMQLEQMRQEKENISNLLNKFEDINYSCIILDRIIELINSNMQLLKKLRITDRIIDLNEFIRLLSVENRFNFLRDKSSYYGIANEISNYKTFSNILSGLEKEYESQKSNYIMMEEYQNDINKKQEELSKTNEEYGQIRKDNEFLNGLVSSLKMKLQRLDRLQELKEDYDTENTHYLEIESKFNELSQKLQSSSDILSDISQRKNDMIEAQKQIQPLESQKRTIETQLTMLQSYQQEYALYKQKYDVIEKLKKYSSPTVGGIQTIFINIYMNKTLDLANQLLSMIFNGEYRLLNYVINDSEFRMPFIGNGMMVDDISSGSTSQICIMGMIVNLVLRNQASTKYNITLLDEIDGGLDHNNRYLFVGILERIVEILQIDQLFIISHSVESALNNVDVIQLSNAPDYDDLFTNANVVYRFEGDKL